MSDGRPWGFTLLEVMISLALVSALLVTLITTVNYHLGIAGRQTAQTLAAALAQQRLYDALKAPVEASGSFEGTLADFSHETTVSESSFPGLVEVSVTVRGRGETVTLVELARGNR